MKSSRRSAKRVLVALSLLFVFLLLAACGIAFLYQRGVDQARLEFAAPAVYVSQPQSGGSAPAGSQLLVSAEAWGQTPITRAELWLNGELVDKQESEPAEGTSPLYAHFSLVVSEGPQQFFVRAVNSQGMIGQSVPIGVTGEAASSESLAAVVADPGQTLEDIAAEYEVELIALRELNPGLGDEQPAEGTEVIIPSSPPGQTPSVGPTIVATPSPPTSVGIVPIPPGVPPLLPIQPGANVTGTVPLPTIVRSLLPKLAIPVFIPPAAPTDLQGSVENCLVRLRWNDNATDELRYEVWMAPLTGAPDLVAQLTPAKGGAAWVEFPSPRTGSLSFWVEAVNLVGKQPSNIVWLQVDPQCSIGSPIRLEVEALEMNVRGAYDKVYCYISLENTPEERLPRDDSAFIQVQEGRGDIASWAAGSKKFVVPVPADGTLEITGECWAWSGNDLDKLGSFSDTTTSSQWTGTRRPLAGGGYEIGYTVTYASEAGGTGKEVTYGYEDPTLPAPYNLSIDVSEYGIGLMTEFLLWSWSGDQKTITGFAVYLNGAPYLSVPGADKVGVGLLQPLTCGQTLRWQVAAVAGETRSPLSAVYEYKTDPCPAYVEVEFDRIEVDCVDINAYFPACPSCETVECWFIVYANNQSESRFNKQFPMKLSCETWEINFAWWPDPPKNSLLVEIPHYNTSLHFGSRWFYINHWGELTKFQQTSKTITMPLDQWRTYQGEHRLCYNFGPAGVKSCLYVNVRAVSAPSP